jgi:DNA repair exonuclease SbcCD ATPase subunit
MLTRVVLDNFQCHQHLEVPLSQITTICGESDSGKSAIMRGLCWVLYNNLSGDSFIRHDQTSCEVKVELDDLCITRFRKKTDNGYRLSDGSVCNAVGRDVPDVVSNITRVGSINVQYQFDAPFWFSLTAGQLTKELNSIADIAWLDRLMTQSNADKRELHTVVTVSESRQAELRDKLEMLSWTVDADKALQCLETLEAEVKSLQAQITQLDKLLLDSIQYRDEIAKIQSVLDLWIPLVKLYNDYESRKLQLAKLSNLIADAPERIPDTTRMLTAFERLHVLFNRLNQLNNLLNKLPEGVPDTSHIQTDFNDVHNLRSQVDQLNNLLDKLPDGVPDTSHIQTDFNDVHNLHSQVEQLNKLLQQVPEGIPDMTPVSKRLSKLEQLQGKIDLLVSFIVESESVVTKHDTARKQLSELQELMGEQTACPVCGSKL